MALPPGLAGYVMGQQMNRQNQAGELQQATGLMAIMQQLEQQRQAQGIRGILSEAGDPEVKMQRLIAMGPKGAQMAGVLSQMQERQAALAEAQRQRAFYQPGNLQNFMTPSQEAIPSPPDEIGGGPARPAVPGQFDMRGFAQAGVMQGIKGADTLLNNIEQRDARRQDLMLRLSRDEERQRRDEETKRDIARMHDNTRRDLAAQQDNTRRDLAAQSYALRRDMMAGRNAEAGKPPAGFRFKPDGDLERIPGGPADLKAEAELQRKASGVGDVEVAIASLRDAYNRLDAGGGITNTDNSFIGNLAASASSSPVGQAVGKALGTQNQSARNEIAMARPALLAALMKATGMSARQMDSNVELKLWLQTATDPTLDVQANRRALDAIERKYISSGVQKPNNPMPSKNILDQADAILRGQ